MVHDYLVMRITNTVGEKQRANALNLETDKDNKDLHGFGSKIADDIAKKYNGQIIRSVEEDKFVVDVMLDLAEKQ